MTRRILHLIGPTCPADAVRQLNALLADWPAEPITCEVAVIGQAPPGLRIPDNIPCRSIPLRCGWSPIRSRELRRAIDLDDYDLIHAWDVESSIAAGDSLPILTTLAEPGQVERLAKGWTRWSGSADHGSLLCHSKLIRQRLIDTGFPARATSLFYPTINIEPVPSTARDEVRRKMGQSPDARVIVTASPPARADGQFFVVWATAVLGKIVPELTVIIPGVSGERARLQRLMDCIYNPEMFHFVGDDYTPAELLAAGDLFVAAAIDDIAPGWLMRAVAAGLPVVGSDVPAVREWISDEENGLLCPPGRPHRLATRIRDALEDPERMHTLAARARRSLPPCDGPATLQQYRTLLGKWTTPCPAVEIG